MTVDDYIDSLPEDRRIAIRSVREVINSRLPVGFEEGVVYGMIAWFVPFTRLAETHNDQPLCVASLGSQKGHMAVYLMSVYGDPTLRAWFEKAYKASGKKLDMGKSCLRFKSLDQLPLDVIGEAIARVSVDQYVATYERTRAGTAEGKQKLAAKAEQVAAKGKAAAATAKAKGKAAVATAKAKGKTATAKGKAAVAKAKASVRGAVARAKQAVGKKRGGARA